MKLSRRVTTRSGSESGACCSDAFPLSPSDGERGGVRVLLLAHDSWEGKLLLWRVVSFAHNANNRGRSRYANPRVRGETWTYPGPSTNSRKTRNALSASLNECCNSSAFHSASAPSKSRG